MVLYAHPLNTFDFDASKKLLRMTRTPATASMSLDDFKEALHNLAGFAHDQPTRSILVDVRQFRYRPPAELGNWRDEVISPRYVKAGIKRFGYIAPTAMMSMMKSSGQRPNRGFEEDAFDDEAKAIAWLSA